MCNSPSKVVNSIGLVGAEGLPLVEVEDPLLLVEVVNPLLFVGAEDQLLVEVSARSSVAKMFFSCLCLVRVVPTIDGCLRKSDLPICDLSTCGRNGDRVVDPASMRSMMTNSLKILSPK